MLLGVLGYGMAFPLHDACYTTEAATWPDANLVGRIRSDATRVPNLVGGLRGMDDRPDTPQHAFRVERQEGQRTASLSLQSGVWTVELQGKPSDKVGDLAAWLDRFLGVFALPVEHEPLDTFSTATTRTVPLAESPTFDWVWARGLADRFGAPLREADTGIEKLTWERGNVSWSVTSSLDTWRIFLHGADGYADSLVVDEMGQATLWVVVPRGTSAADAADDVASELSAAGLTLPAALQWRAAGSVGKACISQGEHMRAEQAARTPSF